MSESVRRSGVQHAGAGTSAHDTPNKRAHSNCWPYSLQTFRGFHTLSIMEAKRAPKRRSKRKGRKRVKLQIEFEADQANKVSRIHFGWETTMNLRTDYL